MSDVLQLQSALTLTERENLIRQEEVIARDLGTFVEVGCALATNRDQRLYRQTYTTFEDYCRDRWDLSRAHAHRMIAAASVTQDLSPIGDRPKSLEQARPLMPLSREQRREAWRAAQEAASGQEITTFHIQQAAAKVRPKPLPKARGRQTPEQRAKEKKNQEKRERAARRALAKAAQEREEKWRQQIVARWQPLHSREGQQAFGSNLIEAIQSIQQRMIAGLKPIREDVALFRAGRILAVVRFHSDNPEVTRFVRSDEGDES